MEIPIVANPFRGPNGTDDMGVCVAAERKTGRFP
jgi:hypothetical protein